MDIIARYLTVVLKWVPEYRDNDVSSKGDAFTKIIGIQNSMECAALEVAVV